MKASDAIRERDAVDELRLDEARLERQIAAAREEASGAVAAARREAEAIAAHARLEEARELERLRSAAGEALDRAREAAARAVAGEVAELGRRAAANRDRAMARALEVVLGRAT